MKFTPDKCPQCGEPARSVVMTLRVRVALVGGGRDGSKVRLDFRQIKRAGGTHLPPGTFEEPVLSCSGFHEWTAEVVDD